MNFTSQSLPTHTSQQRTEFAESYMAGINGMAKLDIFACQPPSSQDSIEGADVRAIHEMVDANPER